MKSGIIWVNPGHLKTTDKKGYGPSFALLDFGEDRVEVKIVNLFDGVEISRL